MKRLPFFKASEVAGKKPLALIAKCGECKLDKGCLSPYMPYSGKGRKKILVVGEAPGKNEDQQRKQFVGQAGELLQSVLRRYGVELREDCWVTNAVICRPQGNKLPERSVEYCRPNLIKTVKDLQPEKILLFGGSAVRGLIEHLWTDESGGSWGVKRWAGWQIPSQELNAWICPTFHPSYLLHERNEVTGRRNEALENHFEQHVASACKLEGRPWKSIPNYLEDVKVVLDADKAATLIRSMISDKVVAWDLETTTKKPEIKNSQIICCGVSNGDLSFAFPWHGEAVVAMRDLFESDTPKVGWNTNRFDYRYVKKIHRFKIRNMKWDGLQAAHLLDSRAGTKSLEFQAFVKLGVRSHKTLKRWMQSGNGTNTLKSDVRLERLLKYAAQDARLEWEIIRMQREMLGDV